MISTLVIGHGYWGQVLTRNLLEHPAYFVAGVQDPDADARRLARKKNIYTYSTLDDALDHARAQLVIIAAPIGDQMNAGFAALQRYSHVMMAKPGPATSEECVRLYAAADRRNRTVTVDYTMMMAPEYRMLQEETSAVYMFDAFRRASGRRSSESIVEDLVVHDVAMLVGLDRSVSVDEAEVSDDSARIVFRNRIGVRSSMIVAEYNADKIERRLIVNGNEWDQLRQTMDRGPVWHRLDEMLLVMSGQMEDNRAIVRETTRVLDEIRRCVSAS